MPKIKLQLEPTRPARAVDADQPDRPDREPAETPLLRAKHFLTGRSGERREKKRLRAPRNITGRRG